MDSVTSNNSLRCWQKALAAFYQAVSSVATVRVTLNKDVTVAQVACWRTASEARPAGQPYYRVSNASWRTKNVLVRRKWFGIEQEVQRESTTNLTRHSRRFCPTYDPQPPGPTASSQFAKCRHLTHSHVRQVFIADCRKPEVVPQVWQWAAERSYEPSWTSFKWFKRSKMSRENYDFTCLMSVQPSSAILFLPHRKHSISIANTYCLMLFREIITVFIATTCKAWVKCRILHCQSRWHIELHCVKRVRVCLYCNKTNFDIQHLRSKY